MLEEGNIIRGIRLQNFNNEEANVYIFITEENCQCMQNEMNMLHIRKKDKIQPEVIDMIINRLNSIKEEVIEGSKKKRKNKKNKNKEDNDYWTINAGGFVTDS